MIHPQKNTAYPWGWAKWECCLILVLLQSIWHQYPQSDYLQVQHKYWEDRKLQNKLRTEKDPRDNFLKAAKKKKKKKSWIKALILKHRRIWNHWQQAKLTQEDEDI